MLRGSLANARPVSNEDAGDAAELARPTGGADVLSTFEARHGHLGLVDQEAARKKPMPKTITREPTTKVQHGLGQLPHHGVII
jgi:hypothetical protein